MLGLGFCLFLAFVASSQSNDLLDRDFWKSQPTIAQIQAKIDSGHSPTAMTRFNFDATGYAILENNSLETVKFLLAQGNDIEKLIHDARTYIFWAAYKGNVELMKYLVSQGAKTDLIDQHGYTMLMFAAATGQENTEVYDYCIELGADVINERTRDGRNALMAYAGRMNSFIGIEYFIEKGLDIHSKDTDGNGVFNHAAKTGNEELMKKLIAKYGVDISKNESTNENAILFATRRFSRSGDETPLSFYQYLEGLGLDPAIVSSKGNTALINLAYQGKNMDIFNYFLEKGVDPSQVDDEGNTALLKSTYRNNAEVVKLFLDYETDINRKNLKGETALTNAVRFNDLEIAQLLVDKGATIDVSDQEGNDLGYQLVDAYRGDIADFAERLTFLIEKGYDVSTINKDGSTLLHSAVKKNDRDLLKYLVSHGLEVNALDANGQSALHLAAMQGNDVEILKYLLEAGADKKVLTSFDESAYDLASQNEILVQKKVDIEFLKI